MKKIIIIGGGIGGLSAGIYGRLAGFQTSIYEKNPIAGGQCMGWNRKGYHIDNCIHWLMGTKETSDLRKVWEEVGALTPETKFVDSEKFYTSYHNGQSATLWRDLDRTEKELLALSPEDTEEIQKFITHVRYATSCEVPCQKPMDMMGIRDYISLGKSMKDMLKVMKEYGKITLQELIERFQHPLIKILIEDFLPEEYQAVPLLVSYAAIVCGNGNIPMGGSLAMTNRMLERYKSLGGELFTNVPVKKVCVKGEQGTGIELENGEIIGADYIICAVDAMETYGHLLDENFTDKKWKKVFENPLEYSTFSNFSMAFTVDSEHFTEKGAVAFGCNTFSVANKPIQRIGLRNYDYEPDWAPKGKTIVQVTILQRDDDYKFWKNLDDTAYRNEKERVVQCVLDRIVSYIPALKNHIECLDCWTPRTSNRYCNAYNGAYMGFVMKPGVKEIKTKGPVKGLKNVYLAGQWSQSPGGLPMAVVSGKFVIQRIQKACL